MSHDAKETMIEWVSGLIDFTYRGNNIKGEYHDGIYTRPYNDASRNP